jgi:hypothetical protein
MSEGTLSTADIVAAIRKRHDPREWVVLSEVRTRCGFSSTAADDIDSERFIDVFAMSCFPSVGHRRIAYEVKVSNADLAAELRNPRKRMHAVMLSHEFWFVLGPGVTWGDGTGAELALLDGCGVILVQPDGKLKKAVAARKRTPYPLPDTFVASLLRRAVEVGRRIGAGLESRA